MISKKISKIKSKYKPRKSFATSIIEKVCFSNIYKLLQVEVKKLNKPTDKWGRTWTDKSHKKKYNRPLS